MAGGAKRDMAGAASYFVRRAQAAVEAADHARSEDAQAAFYKEAETWLYMANHCLDPDRAERPQGLPPPLRRAAGERRSFQED
jgi:hypothetical protein